MPFPADGSAIPIANSALTLVGTRLISAVTDTSKECTLVKTNWDIWRKTMLRMGLWKFAKNDRALVKDPSYATPQFRYQNRYALPADFIRLQAFNDLKGNADGGDAPYQVMSGFILTDMSYANLTYIADVTDVTMWDPLFQTAFIAYIYQNICKSLTGTDADPKVLMRAMQSARFTGATEDPSEQLDIDVWMQSRVGGPSIFRDPPFPSETTPTFP